MQISRAALAAAQLSLEELLPADLSAKHCDAAVQEAVVASANTEPAAATVQQSCEFFGEALACNVSFQLERAGLPAVQMLLPTILQSFSNSFSHVQMICLCHLYRYPPIQINYL